MAGIRFKRRGPLQKRIIAFTLFCILLICAVVSVISFYLFSNYLKKGIISTTSVGLANLSESVSTEFNEVTRLVRYCQSDSGISEYLSSLPNSNTINMNKIYDQLDAEYKRNSANSYITRAAVISDSHYLQVCQATYSTTKHLPEILTTLPYYNTLLSAENYDFSCGIQIDPFLPGSPKYMIPIIRPIIYKYNSDRIGYVFVEFSSTLITDQLKKYHMDEGDALLFLMEDHAYIYENGKLTELSEYYLKDITLKSSYSLSSGTLVQEVDSAYGHYTILKTPVKMNGCYLAHVISPAGMRSERYMFILLFTCVLILVIGIGVVLNVYMNRYMYKPVNKIREKITRTAAGDFTRDPSIEWNHELGEIGKGINDLSESVNELMETRLADEKKKKDLEYQMLQSQINPHFLYNTLNSIKMMAQVQGATGISEMTTSLASLLRSISKGTSLLVPISEELTLVKDYFTIQNYRYGGMIEFEIQVQDASINHSKIVKFTLQPLVENAIFHGLEPKGGIGKITINLYCPDADTICIEVTDDGVGIPEDKVSTLLQDGSGNNTEFFREIGIHNVNKRLQYEFGDCYGISVESVLGDHTTMRVLLPKGEGNV